MAMNAILRPKSISDRSGDFLESGEGMFTDEDLENSKKMAAHQIVSEALLVADAMMEQLGQ
jgi:hypothetical protein